VSLSPTQSQAPGTRRLCIRSATLLEATEGRCVAAQRAGDILVRLDKRIPLPAGLGGEARMRPRRWSRSRAPGVSRCGPQISVSPPRLDRVVKLSDKLNADREGRFHRLLPVHTWPLTARDSGFGAVTLKVSGGTRAPTLVFRLPNVDTRTLPVVERLTPPCCQGDLFTDPGR
jgi:hypothetical protein